MAVILQILDDRVGINFKSETDDFWKMHISKIVSNGLASLESFWPSLKLPMYLCSSKNSMWFKRLSLMPQFGHSNQWIGIPVNQLLIIFTQTSSSWENYQFESKELLHFSLGMFVQLQTRV